MKRITPQMSVSLHLQMTSSLTPLSSRSETPRYVGPSRIFGFFSASEGRSRLSTAST